MKLPLLAKNSRKISYVCLALTGFLLMACDGQSTLIVGGGEMVVVASASGETPPVQNTEATGSNTGVALASPEANAMRDDVEDFLFNIAERGSIKIMPVGDSITQGVRGAKSYRQELSHLTIGAGCPMTFVGSQTSNSPGTDFFLAHEGYSGHAVDDFLFGPRGDNLGIVSAIGNHKPDVVLLHVGSNDIFKGHDVASTVAEIDQMIAVIGSTKPGTLVLIANLIPWISTEAGDDKPGLVQELGNQIESYVRESNNPNLQLVDVRNGFTADLMQVDMIHPNEQGDAHIADAFFDALFHPSYCN